MSHRIIQIIQQRLAKEVGTIRHAWTDRYRIALIYPNFYHQGMSNLGFQSVYHLLNNREDCLCERFFLPDDDELKEHRKTGFPLVSYESQQPLADFDLIALSVSFENDYLNLPLIFELGRVPFFADDRTADYPLVVFGGVCAFLNPEPLADVVDVVVVGEAEPILSGLLDILLHAVVVDESLWGQLAVLPGIYLPHHPQTHTPLRQFLTDLDYSVSRSFIHAEDTEFGDMSLTEVSRGCSRGCRFCAAGYIYLPPRERSLDNLLNQVDEGLCQRNKIGLVGAAVADHSQIDPLQREIIDRGGQVSVSSLRLDALRASEVASLHASGLRTAAIAPEAGSQRLRDLINKNLDEEQILHAVQLLADGGIRNLKLYFLIGLPNETQVDLDELIALTEKIRLIWREAGRARGQMGSVTLSVNPFIPKPFTPLQWCGMEPEKSLKKKLRFLHAAIARMPNTDLISESIRCSVLQAFLSRGDRQIGRLLPDLAEGGNLKQLCKKAGIALDDYVTRERGQDESFPWEVIDQGFSRDYLWREYQRGLQGKLSPPCSAGCTRCGVCGGR
ncbi:radical SAM protein [Malonomonas rubra]|uniref:radical SAM protein n=1 Tax=Malonomonas rubra TaxID=57040 RepID=UPI0026F1B61E|nr:radical SAM protein [Malonomonas rubra]